MHDIRVRVHCIRRVSATSSKIHNLYLPVSVTNCLTFHCLTGVEDIPYQQRIQGGLRGHGGGLTPTCVRGKYYSKGKRI